MKKFTKLFISFLTIFAISVCTVTSASATTASTNSFTYDFKPKSTVYNTTTSSIYSDTVDFGWSNQEAEVNLVFSVNVPPKTSSFTITVQGILQKKSGSSWVNIRTLNVSKSFSNTSTTTYKYVIASASDEKTYFADLTKSSTYRVKYTVTKNTTSAKYNLMPNFSMIFETA